jgi:hypothetical protein
MPARTAYAEQLNEFDGNAGTPHDLPRDRLIYVAMDARWKLIYRARVPAESELYDVVTDPYETNNQYRSDHPQYLRLKATLDRYDGYREEPFSVAETDPEALERLRSLGYVDGE